MWLFRLFLVFLAIDDTSTHGKRVFERCTLIIYDPFINPAYNNSTASCMVWDISTNAKSFSCHLRHFIQKTDFSFLNCYQHVKLHPGNFGLNVNWIFMALYKKHSAQAIDNACMNNIAFIYFFFSTQFMTIGKLNEMI